MMGNLSQAGRGHFAMLVFSLAVAGSFSLGHIVANEIHPVAITAARFIASAVILGLVVAVGVKIRREFLAAPWRYLVLGSLMATYFILMFVALKSATAVSTSVVFAITPLFSAIFGWFLLRQAATPRICLALAIGAAGAVWVIFRADFSAMRAFRIGVGEAVFMIGCAAHALYTPLVRKLNRGEPLVVFVFGTVTAAAVLLVALGWSEVRETDWPSLRPVVWVTIAYLTVIASILTFYCVMYASLRLPSSKVMAYTYLTPSWVLLWEIALGQELPRVAVLAGVLATVLALGILLRQEDRADAAELSGKGEV